MQNTFSQLGRVEILLSETQYICVGNWFCRDAKDIAYDSTDTRVRSAKRFHGRWVIMRFNFERDFKFIVKVNDASVIDECRNNPGSVDHVGGRFEVSLDKTIDYGQLTSGRHGLSSIVYGHFCLERFMDAVFAPCLCDGFKLHVSGIALFFYKISLNGLHL